MEGHAATMKDLWPNAGSHIPVEPPRGIPTGTNGPRGDDGDDMDDVEDTQDADGASSQSSGEEEEGDDHSEGDESEEEDDEDDSKVRRPLYGLQSDSESDNEVPRTFSQPKKKGAKRVSKNYRGTSTHFFCTGKADCKGPLTCSPGAVSDRRLCGHEKECLLCAYAQQGRGLLAVRDFRKRDRRRQGV